MRGTKFSRAELVQCRFHNVALADCDFRGVKVLGGDFNHALLAGARFGGAQLKMADLRGANLRGARELTSEQLLQSLTDQSTILPNGSNGPYRRMSGAEKRAERASCSC
jgi:uncharacterized protein YjbI with pentapeptide repeats